MILEDYIEFLFLMIIILALFAFHFSKLNSFNYQISPYAKQVVDSSEKVIQNLSSNNTYKALTYKGTDVIYCIENISDTNIDIGVVTNKNPVMTIYSNTNPYIVQPQSSINYIDPKGLFTATYKTLDNKGTNQIDFVQQ